MLPELRSTSGSARVRLVATLAIIVAMAAATGGVALAELKRGSPERIAALVKQAMGTSESVAARVGDLEITTQRIELEAAVRKAQGDTVNRDRILAVLIDDFVVLNEA